MTTSINRAPVIAGLGITELGKVYGRTAPEFAAEAVRLAAADAGIDLHEVDGLLTNTGLTADVGLGLQRDLGLRHLRLLSEVQAYGSSARTIALVGYSVGIAVYQRVEHFTIEELEVEADADLLKQKRQRKLTHGINPAARSNILTGFTSDKTEQV
jgi:hypothetical protein